MRCAYSPFTRFATDLMPIQTTPNFAFITPIFVVICVTVPYPRGNNPLMNKFFVSPWFYWLSTDSTAEAMSAWPWAVG